MGMMARSGCSRAGATGVTVVFKQLSASTLASEFARPKWFRPQGGTLPVNNTT